MQQFIYTVKDNLGIHARPAGLLTRLSKQYESKITIQKGNKTVDAEKTLQIMTLGVKCNDNVIVAIEGADEEAACKVLKDFFESEL